MNQIFWKTNSNVINGTISVEHIEFRPLLKSEDLESS